MSRPYHHDPLASRQRLSAIDAAGLREPIHEEAFDRLARLAARVLGSPTAVFSVITDSGQVLQGAEGVAARWREGRSMPLAYSYCQHVVASGEPVVIPDAAQDPRFQDSPALREDGARSYVGVPVRVDGQVVGALCAIDHEPRAWSERDAEALLDLSTAVLAVIEKRRARSDAMTSRRAERRLQAQNAAARILASARTLEEAGGQVLRALCESMRWHTGIFWEVDAEAGVLVCANSWSLSSDGDPFAAWSRRVVFLPGVGLPGRVWQTGEAAWVEDLAEECDARQRVANVTDARGAFAFPLLAGGEVTGVLEFITPRVYAPDRELLDTMAALGAQIEPFVSRKRAEERAARLAALVDSSQDAIISTTPEAIITYWNRGAERLFGHPAEAVIGRSALLIVPPERRGEFEENRERVAAGEHISPYDTVRQCEGGRRGWVSLALSPVLGADGKVEAIVAVARDITPERALRAELEAAAEEMAAVFSALPDLVLTLDSAGRYVKVAPSAPDLLVQEASQLLGRTVDEVLPAALAARIRDEIRQALATGRPRTLTYDLEVNERLTTFEGAISPLGADRVILVARDITSRVQAEQRARLQEEQVRQAQKMEAIGRLAAGIAHDFNNVLTVIGGTVDMVLMDLDPADPVTADLREVADATRRAAALTRQLLSLGRRPQGPRERTDLRSVVQGITPMLQRVLPASMRIETRLQEVPPVRVDAAGLEQVILNLVVNARDAMPAGGRLELRTYPGTLSDSVRRLPPGGSPGAPAVVLEVTDTGSGMDQATLERIYEPFFSTKPRDQGTGLGLATAYGIVQQNDGWIEVDSAPGCGTRFRLYFPPAGGEDG